MYSAAKTIDLSKPNNWKVAESTDWVAVTATTGGTGYGAHITLSDKDSRYVIMATNTSADTAATVTVVAGDGPQASPHTPSVSLAAGKTAYIQVESGGYKFINATHALSAQVDGGNGCDKVFVTSTTDDVKVCLLHTVL